MNFSIVSHSHGTGIKMKIIDFAICGLLAIVKYSLSYQLYNLLSSVIYHTSINTFHQLYRFCTVHPHTITTLCIRTYRQLRLLRLEQNGARIIKTR